MPMTEGKKIKILLVEDDKFLQKILTTKFAKDDFEVLLASDGEEGLAKIRSQNPEIVLLDLILPKMTGFDLMTEMRSTIKDKSIAVIILSNLGQPEDIARAKELGALDFMIKSEVSMSAIVQKVKSVYSDRQK